MIKYTLIAWLSLLLRDCIYKVHMCASSVSKTGLLYRTASARALFPHKIVVVCFMSRSAGPLAEIFLRAIKISANGPAGFLI